MKTHLALAALLALSTLTLLPTAAAACEHAAVVVITDSDKGLVADRVSTGDCTYDGAFVRVVCTSDPMCVYVGAGVN